MAEISISAPASAAEGEAVSVSATISNVSPYHYSFKTEIYAEGTLLLNVGEIITSGSSRTYNAAFAMPGYDVTILVWVERWAFDHWAYDNSASKEVAVAVGPPPIAGTITGKELDYQNVWQALPLYDIPAGTQVRVRIAGRNDTSINQKMGVYWFVSDPEGYVAQEYTNWETFWTGPGLEQLFVGGGFALSKAGKYTIWVELLMNPDDPQVVDRYIGDLCTVAAVPELFAGRISRKELDYDAVRVPFSVQ